MIHIETPRLRLRDWQEQDFAPFRHMNADEAVMRYFPRTLSHNESDKMYRVIQEECRQYGYGLYAVELKETANFIGFIGFHRAVFDADFTPCTEIGWRLIKESWGKGYATEGAAACLTHGFDNLGFQDVYSFTAALNTPSQNVMVKIGMDYVKHFDHPRVEDDSPLKKHVLYHVSV